MAAEAARGSALTGTAARQLPRCGFGSAGSSPISTEAPQSEAPQSGAISQSVTVTVPRTAIVHLGADGRVVAVMTNTGCPPRPGDDIWVRRAGSNSLEPASWATFRSQRWTGDFSRPGVVVTQFD
ncbi:unannotated protein [freshwater metagenome]|uniref:Unannotated protein n=1 Tax=freshwater metagenome TaxID=449393 RepID=A0A6J6FPC5_9ZZZZ